MLSTEVLSRELELVRSGATLPSWFYHSEEVYRAEMRCVFRASWQYCAHVDDLPQAGGYILVKVGPYEVIISREKSGELHAMLNACVHRGSRVATGPGRRSTIQCPYHGWTYELNGALRSAPGCESHPAVASGSLHLPRVRLTQWGPLVFANISEDGPDFADVVKPLATLDLPWPTVRRVTSKTYRYGSNWKIAMENSTECYHCAVAHPGFAALVDIKEYMWKVDGFCAIQGATRKHGSGGQGYQAATRTDDETGEDSRSYFIWPNLWLIVFPGPPNLTVARWLPIGLDETICQRWFYFSNAFSEEETEELLLFIDEIQKQDVEMAEHVQANIGIDAFERGFYRLDGTGAAEHGSQQFDTLLLQAMIRDCERRSGYGGLSTGGP